MRLAFGFLLCVAFGACLKPSGSRYPSLPSLGDGALYAIAFDVGQSDAMLFLHQGKSILIDAGSTRTDPHRVANRVPRRLEALTGKRYIDYMVVTHYHSDHFGRAGGSRRGGRRPTGLYALLEQENVKIGTLVDRGFWTVNGAKGGTQKSYEAHIRDWMRQGAVKERRQARVGDTFDMGAGLKAEVFAASGNGQLDKLQALFPSLIEEYPPSENDYSIGVKFTMGEFELFTAGDLTGQNRFKRYGYIKESYNDMESRLAKSIGRIEVYRVNHHGSGYSSNECFVDVLKPQVSLISSGPNSYRHPDVSVYQRLKRHGDVWITGGADERVKDEMLEDIVGGDIDIVVAPGGQQYWVNGRPYQSLSETDEHQSASSVHCDIALGANRQTLEDAPVSDEGAPD